MYQKDKGQQTINERANHEDLDSSYKDDLYFEIVSSGKIDLELNELIRHENTLF